MNRSLKIGTGKKVLLTVLIFFMVFQSLTAQENYQNIVPIDSPIYATIKRLYIEQGISTPSTAGPWSEQELLLMADRLDAKKLSETGRQALKEVYAQLRAPLDIQVDDDFSLDIGFTAAFETYQHQDSVNFDDEWDWVVGYTERTPVAEISFEFAMHDWFYTYSELGYKKNRYGHNSEDNTTTSSFLYSPEFSTNLFDMKYVDFETPYRAFVTAGGEGWNLQFGRDKLSWGNGRTGNLVVGSHLDYNDFLSFKTFHDSFNYQFLTIFIDYPGWDTDGGTPSGSEVPSEGIQLFLGHRLDFRLWDVLNLAVTENVMYKHDFLDLKYLNPAYIFHNFNNRGMFNAIASVEADLALTPGISLYGQYVLDQARAPLENGTQPDCTGMLAGVNFELPVENGYFSGGIEYALTDPYLYQRDLIDFKVTRRQFIIGYSFKTYTDFLGYQYGGDAQVIDLEIGYTVPFVGEITAGVRKITHGDIGVDETIDTFGDYPDPDDPTPHGDTAEITTILSLTGSLDIDQLFDLGIGVDMEIYSGINYITIENLDNIAGDPVSDVQWVSGVSLGI